MPITVLRELTDSLYEIKLEFYSPTFGDRIRTFCMCPAGEVTMETTGGLEPVITVNADDTIRAAAGKMVERGIGAVVVVEEGKPVGILTERDVTKQSIKANDAMSKPVRSVMSKSLVTAPESMSIQQGMEGGTGRAYIQQGGTKGFSLLLQHGVTATCQRALQQMVPGGYLPEPPHLLRLV
jgi:hypothetical protein